MARATRNEMTNSSRKPTKKRKKSPSPPRPFWQQAEVWGIVFLAMALLTLLSLISASRGVLTESWLLFLSQSFGWGVYLTPIGFGAVGFWFLLKGFDRHPRVGWAKPVGAVLIFALALATAHLSTGVADPLELARKGGGGGYVGWLISHALVVNLGVAGAWVIIVALFGIGFILLSGLSVAEIGVWLKTRWDWLRELYQAHFRTIRINAPLPPPSNGPGSSFLDKVKQALPSVPGLPASEGAAGSMGLSRQGTLHPRIIGGQEWRVPSINEIFEEGTEPELSQREIRERVKIIEETLASFGVPANVVEVNQGPTVTQFGLEPGYIERRDRQGQVKRVKIKVSKIISLSNDLALALSASPIRIEAPVPGRSIVGLEVPNAEASLVPLRSVMDTDEFRQLNSKLAIALGQDVAGQPAVADLATMPHLLIAGATGSGKSVCINAIVACLLCHNTPDDLQLLMIDPKRVELTNYNGIPHLIAPVVVELERVVGVLHWATKEMERRYKLFSKAQTRNLEAYNEQLASRGERGLPCIVVVIDELADLMMIAPDEVERHVCRIAQMARATGIHLVIATQRPSVDVVTGLIKANFPARVSFAVTSQVDSRVILDTGGAERLLGRGDMLYMAPDASKLARLQGCFVSDRELNRLVRYWKGIHTPEPLRPEAVRQEPLWADFKELARKAEQEDDMLERAIEVVRTQNRASISLLQRRLRIGYSRAARLIDMLEERGIIGPQPEPGRSRPVLAEPARAWTDEGQSSPS